MANKTLFSTRSRNVADTTNRAGGKAYSKSKKAALASYALVGTFNDTFYSDARFNLDTVLKLLEGADDRYVAQLAVYARKDGYMKDMPSFLVAWLAAKQSPYFETAFNRVIDNGKMLRNFVQYIRSGELGRKSFGTRIKRSIQNWFANRDVDSLMRAVPGNNPTLADIVKMVHPKGDNEHKAFYAWLLNKELRENTDSYSIKTRDGWRKLPKIIGEFEDFKRYEGGDTPNIPFQLLTGLDLSEAHWKGIARDARWMMTRMNLNTFARHGVFQDKTLTKMIADRLGNEKLVKQARQFPFQLLSAYLNSNVSVPASVKNALQDAMEHALTNVPVLEGETVVFIDISGSMNTPVTGYQKKASTKVTCVQAAACFGAALLRVNPNNTKVVGVNTRINDNYALNPRDSVMTNATKLGRMAWGGTGLGAGFCWLKKTGQTPDNVIFVSDTESWADCWTWGGGTSVQAGFKALKGKNKKAKLINIDIQASVSSQAKTSKDVLNIAGFSDQVFTVIDSFVKGDLNGDHLVSKIENSVEV